ncbi:MAG TPA: hypothetical protein VFT09_07055 [Ilumatobacteraceae bacterium]|nr:hypothetical protein [Ilumatobacteraceae bacterium]
MRRSAALVLSIAAVIAVVAACGGDEGPTAAGAATTPVSTIPAAAEHIIPVNADLAEVVDAPGLGDQVVATDISATYRIVQRDQFCAFMALARSACPA